jgi:anti-sigma regulatory factor (Ser/Thr protein kinase)
MILQRACTITDSVAGDQREHWWLSAVDQLSCPVGRWPGRLSSASGGPRLARCVLRAVPTAPKTARDFTRAKLADWQLDNLFDDAEMTVSELVTNALRHGLRGLRQPRRPHPVQLVLVRDEHRLLSVVTDPSDQAPVPAQPDEAAETGRGLRIVEAVSVRWGWAPLGTGGKAVWAAFDIL